MNHYYANNEKYTLNFFDSKICHKMQFNKLIINIILRRSTIKN